MPFSIQLQITYRCDQRCKHCYIYGNNSSYVPEELNLQQLEAIVNKFQDFCISVNKRPSIFITGGDPLLHPNFNEFIELLSHKKIPFAIMGNPFHLNETIALHLKECGCQGYQLSLDGIEKTHDYIRKPGSFKSTIDAINIINNAGLRSVIMCTVSKMNISEVPSLVEIAVNAHADTFGFARYCPSKNDIENMPNPLEYRNFLDKMFHVYEKFKGLGTKFPKKDHLWTLYEYEKGIFNIPENSIPTMIYDGCHCAISHMSILPNGDCYACRRCNSKVGNIFEENVSFKDIFFGKRMDEYRKYDNFEGCNNCELLRFCRGCPAVSASSTGNFYSRDPQCWKGLI